MIELEDRMYQIKKIGNRDEPENRNQEAMFDYSGIVINDKVEIGKPFILESYRDWFRTSNIRSIYQHEDASDNDKLILPKNFPIASDLDIPELKNKDILLATMNSIYLLQAVEEEAKNE